jgi:hypothetical protein
MRLVLLLRGGRGAHPDRGGRGGGREDGGRKERPDRAAQRAQVRLRE